MASGRVRFDEQMSLHTSFRVGGPADAFVEVKTADELVALVSGLADREIPYRIIGGGTNLIVTDAGISGVVIRMKPCLSDMSIENDEMSQARVRVWAGTGLRLLCSRAIRKGLKGMNFALGIPGTVGGGIRMNAGTALGSMADVLTSITVVYPNGRMETIERSALRFSYRKLLIPLPADAKNNFCEPIIVSGCFSLFRGHFIVLKQEARDILRHRRHCQPVQPPSAGCIFKNPPADKPAGELIDRSGLKGRRIGGAEVSLKHANFIVNTGSASASDILALMGIVQDIVFKKFKVNLEPEVIVIGN